MTLLWAGAVEAKQHLLPEHRSSCGGSLTAGLVCSLDAALEAAVVGEAATSQEQTGH